MCSAVFDKQAFLNGSFDRNKIMDSSSRSRTFITPRTSLLIRRTIKAFKKNVTNLHITWNIWGVTYTLFSPAVEWKINQIAYLKDDVEGGALEGAPEYVRRHPGSVSSKKIQKTGASRTRGYIIVQHLKYSRLRRRYCRDDAPSSTSAPPVCSFTEKIQLSRLPHIFFLLLHPREKNQPLMRAVLKAVSLNLSELLHSFRRRLQCLQRLCLAERSSTKYTSHF